MSLDPQTGQDGAKIEDVARAAGVSIMSVSRALRGIEGVSPQTRDKIIQLAEDMGYVPNRHAGALAQATSTLVCISVPTLSDAVFAEIIGGMRETLTHAGFETIIETSDYDPDREAAWVERMVEWSPAGLVLSGVDHAPSVQTRLRAARIPVMELWDATVDPIDMCVGIDHVAIGAAMGKYLWDSGYRHPAAIGISEGRDPRADKRRTGLATVFAEAGIEAAQYLLDAPPSFEAGHDGAVLALDQAERPDVLYFLNDHLAFGGMMACQKAGLGVPGDIGIAGFNGLNINNVLPLRLTTSASPRAQMGKIAARMLVAAVRGACSNRCVTMPVRLEIGQTTQVRLTEI